MKQINLWMLISLFLLSGSVAAQKKTTKPAVKKVTSAKVVENKKPDVAADEKKVRDMVAFLEFMLNTLGSSSTPIRDKEVLITESYSKIFRDSKVQVEDDLDEERRVITNKDVIAYLKDVNFFFSNVRFEFTIEDIKSSTTPDGNYFYKVTASRNLTGTTSDQKIVNKTMVRYIEINYNPNDQDLKIVSMYTNEYDDKQALKSWWNELSYEWQSVLMRKLNVTDSVSISQLKDIIAVTDLDLSNNRYIQTLEPLSPFYNLTSLTLAGTNVTDLTPIRNLTELVKLDISDTRISDLSPLKYSIKLEELIFNNTTVNNIAVISKMRNLQRLEMRGTSISDFTPVASLVALQEVNLSNTRIADLTPIEGLEQLTELNLLGCPVEDLDPLKGLTNLVTLDLDSTLIRSLGALNNMASLQVLKINHTAIADLSSLQKLNKLQKIYCDQTLVKKEAADGFMAINSNVLVIFDSKDLMVWWNRLPEVWQQVFIKAANISKVPSKEELAKIPLLDSINISGITSITDLQPLLKLQRLKKVVATKTTLSDLSPLKGLTEIEYIDISETAVRDLSILTHLTAIKVLKVNDCSIEKIELLKLSGLQLFCADGALISDTQARRFLENHPGSLLIYKTDRLKSWWSNLTDDWKSVFIHQIGKASITTESLHHLVEQETLNFKDAPIIDLSALSEFVNLKELHFSGTSLTSITPIESIKSLRSLHATNSPIKQIETVEQLQELEDLDISNTPVEDLRVVGNLSKIKTLNFAGTQVKKLNGLERLEHLEYLDCSNTNISKLDQLEYLPIKTLKCYNTKVSGKSIENFKDSHPDCQVVYYK